MKATLKNIKHWWSRNRWKLGLTLWCAVLALVLALVLFRCGGDDKGAAKLVTAHEVNGLLEVVVPRGVSNECEAFTGFVVNFNAQMHVPNSVSYVLTRDRLDGAVERYGEFEQAPGVRGCPQPDAYSGSGYERGHMAPAQDMAWSEAAMHQSFMMINVCPQDKRLNEGGWAKLEEKVREWAQRDSVLVVVTGPVLHNRLARIEPSEVAIPQHFFKVIIAPCAQPMRAIGFIYPNGSSNGALNDYAVTVDEVERITRLNFFHSLADKIEEPLESRCNLKQWGVR